MKSKGSYLILIFEIIVICLLHAAKINDEQKQEPSSVHKEVIAYPEKDNSFWRLAFTR